MFLLTISDGCIARTRFPCASWLDMLRDRLILSGEIHVKKEVNFKSGTPFVGTFYDYGELMIMGD